MKPPAFDYVRPSTLAEATAILAAHPGEAQPIAGGQSLMPMLAFRLAAPAVLVDIGRLPGLNRIDIGPEGIRLGALVRWCEIERERRLAAAHPLLLAAIGHIAHYQIRNRGTVGGSLAHCDPASELSCLAVTCEAEITVVGSGSSRTVPAIEFIQGAMSTDLAPDELVTAIRFPPWPEDRRWAFEEFARRTGDFAMAAVALFYDLDAGGRVLDPHVGVIGAADRPLRLAAVEALLAGRTLDHDLVARASQAGRKAADPLPDIHAEADYRRALVGTLIERALARAAGLAAIGEAA